MQTIGPLCLESCCAAQVAYGGMDGNTLCYTTYYSARQA